MASDTLFTQAFVYLAAAVVSVPLAKRFGLGSVLGYLAAGVAIGRYGFGLVGSESADVMHVAEFGVVLMLFLIGLELEPRALWRLRVQVFGLGGAQVALTAFVIMAIGLALDAPWRIGLAAGLILALSSTAIVLQTLAEKGLGETDAGQRSFAILLFQDIAVIPILAILPLLAAPGAVLAGGDGHEASPLAALPPWAQAAALAFAVLAVVGIGRFVVAPAFQLVARAQAREVFTAAALLLVIGIALLMQQVGLSPALGTFLAGVVLAGSPYRHELVSDIEPFKGLLLGLFFIAVGASLDLSLVTAEPLGIAALVAGLVAVKIAVLVVLGRAFGMSLDQRLLMAVALCQGGEFAFVLFSFAAEGGVLPADVASRLVAAVALSMALTPIAMLINERLVAPRLGTTVAPPRPDDAPEDGGAPVIIAGFGRFGHIVGRLLQASGIKATVLDHDSDQVDLLRTLGLEVYYGDASRVDLLHAAGAARARLLVVATEDHEKTLEIVRAARSHFPHLAILARARGRLQAYELLDAGVRHVYRETLDSSLALGVDALTMLGVPARRAWRNARAFRRHDESTVRELAALRHDRGTYISQARERIRDFERVLKDDRALREVQLDEAWDSSSLRREFGGENANGSRASYHSSSSQSGQPRSPDGDDR